MRSDAPKPKRILNIGSSGSGKSTLARAIGDALSLPVYYMDREVFWLPGWVERDKQDQVVQIKRIVAMDAWVFEGNNSATFPIRGARAQMLIWLDPPHWLRVIRVIRRALRERGTIRPASADDCPENLSMLPGFLWFVLSTARNSRRNQRAFFEATSLPKHRFVSIHETNRFLESLA